METIVRQRDFSKALSAASRFVSSRAQLPILSNIALKVTSTKMLILATNLEISLAREIGAKTIKKGELAIPARVITELVSNLKEETITLKSDKENLKITTEDFKGDVVGLNLSDFPSIPLKIGKKGVSLSYSDFIVALNKVLFAVSRDDTRANLTGVLMIFDTSGLTMVASDGFRLSYNQIKLKHTLKEKVIIPKSILSELVRFGEEDREEKIEIKIDKQNNQVIFSYQNMTLASRLIEGEFPDFDRIVPRSSTTQVSLSRVELLDAIKLSSVMARESANVVNLSVDKDLVRVEAKSSKSGTQEVKVAAKVEGGEIQIAYNYRFIEELLSYLNGQEVVIEFTQSNAPGVFKVPGEKDFFHLIMPVKS